MRRALVRGLLIAVVAMLMAMPFLSTEASAHSPLFPSGNTNIENSYTISDPAISWAIYSSLDPGMGGYTQVNYYKFDMHAGDRLNLMLLCPVDDYNRGFRAEMILMGPLLNNSGELPPNVQVWPGYGYQVIPWTPTNVTTYEGFSPSAFKYLCKYDQAVNISGSYFVAITNPQLNGVSGNYGFAPGYEEVFTIPVIITMPFSLMQIYIWEGQNFWNVVLPWFAVIAMGAIFLFLIKRERFDPMSTMHLAVYVGGLWLLGTAAITITQCLWCINLTGLVPEVMITLFIILGQTLLAFAILWQAFRVQRQPGTGRRAGIFVLGLLGLFIWAGFIVGPLLVMLGACLPWKKGLGR
jgi:hypothetical protein